ncbi:MAG: respiratory nitrate reductase subunit gamma [Thermoanaerobacterales bacterium]|nr:respiratory nitrate reductase subunit gamma [Bacillota bacterium]MDI6907228.1 respiratory nitrate reductase subunit gamma [Thermoanaerobacterales bacterium]
MEVFVGQVMPYITVAIFLGGITWRIWRWMIPRIVHNITLSPFASNWVEAVLHPVIQLLTMWNVLKFDRGLWPGAFLLHFALINVLGGHVVGFYTLGEQFNWVAPRIITAEQSTAASDFLGTMFGLIFLLALVWLLYRRFAVEKVKAVSATSDYLHLVLLITIACIGNYMRLVPEAHMTYAEVREFLAGLFLFQPLPFPDNAFFLYHFLFVQILMIVFPFSKLMHTFGMFWERWIVNRPYKEWPVGLPGVQVPLQK